MDLSDKLVTTSGEKESHDFSFSCGPRCCSAVGKKTTVRALQNYLADFFRQGWEVLLLPKIRNEIGGHISPLYGTSVTLTPKKFTQKC